MKMTKKFDRLDDAFNVATEVVTEALPTKVEKQKPDRLTKDDIEKDYEYTRGNLYSIIELSLIHISEPTRPY